MSHLPHIRIKPRLDMRHQPIPSLQQPHHVVTGKLRAVDAGEDRRQIPTRHDLLQVVGQEMLAVRDDLTICGHRQAQPQLVILIQEGRIHQMLDIEHMF